MVVSVDVGLWKMLMLRQVGLLVIERLHARYIKNNNPQSAYALHILNNKHEYGPVEKTMTLLKPVKNTSLLTPYEQFFIQAFHKSGRLVSKQNPGEPNPLLQMAINTSHPPT